MASHAPDHNDAGHPAMDYAEHDRTYSGFLVFVKWGTIIVCGIMVGMAIGLL
ncbi:MAG: aa3-type cytochrome c oxidase subunit IV [Beijerinckiaceae bacterium]